ncbi:MAG: 6-phosphogluconolactonase [Candidatus Limnocylindrales bacterium]
MAVKRPGGPGERGRRGEPRGRGEPGEPAVHVLADPAAVALAAADRIASSLVAAVAARGRAHLATTGGSTVVGIYRELSAPPLRDRVPWDRVDVWFGDDRFVPRDHPRSNVLPVDQVLLRGAAFSGGSGTGTSGIDVELGTEPGVTLPAGRLHPFPCGIAIGEGRGAAWCAAAYAAEVAATVPRNDAGWPVFDLVLVGIGPDGHLLSVFPGSPALGSDLLALAIPAPTHVEPQVERVTLNPAVLGAAREILAMINGAAKASVVGEIFGPLRDPARWPAQLARRAGATWLLDAAAATALPGRGG